MKIQQYIGRGVELIYMDRTNKCTKRTVTVHRLQGDFVICYDHGKRAFRRLKRHNILAIMPVSA